MIFYHPNSDLHFNEYGIEIPMVDDRASRVFESLKNEFPPLEYTNLKTLKKIQLHDLENSHDMDFLNRLFGTEDERQEEIYKCYELIGPHGNFDRFNPHNKKKSWASLIEIILKQIALGYASSEYALKNGFSYFLGGGMHHAMSFSGRGFCLLNDITIILKKLQDKKLIKTAWIVDVDVHKGDGAPEILLKNKDLSIKTFSIHMKNGWPLSNKENEDKNAPWFIPSTLDVEIDTGEEKSYLKKLEEGLLELEKMSPRPDLVMIVNGADPYEEDELPSSSLIKLSKNEMFLRDKLVYQFFKVRNIPQSYFMAGGYGKKSWEIYFQFLQYVLRENKF